MLSRKLKTEGKKITYTNGEHTIIFLCINVMAKHGWGHSDMQIDLLVIL